MLLLKLYLTVNKKTSCEKIKQIPMSHNTTARKSEILTEDVLTPRDEAIRSAPCIALAVHESTDVSDNAQLLVYVRFYHTEKEFCEDLSGVTPLRDTCKRKGHIHGHRGDAERGG